MRDLKRETDMGSYIAFAVISAVIGALIAKDDDKALGAILGGLFGPIGWLVVLFKK